MEARTNRIKNQRRKPPYVAVIFIVVFVNEEGTHSFLSLVFLHSTQHQKPPNKPTKNDHNIMWITGG